MTCGGTTAFRQHCAFGRAQIFHSKRARTSARIANPASMDSVDGIANGGLLERAATSMQDILTAGKQHLGPASNQTQTWRGFSSGGEAGEEARVGR